ncbi:hypothetical protein BLA24_26845 [Streptomyces cinnamoneus]|uniref:Uncharacterized protein n=1 Tax=Streptomyces cinnamoneus TaxID=53446 RepID=A0A2G1XEI1_STRCJ|nr:hypothetical protein [Streptomyces cinnamoneus]PHQ49636.1 hypothetical protein BLA24_26845 [Streptomyces cinnamoneus]PPT14643.1 hypothetical protein CYQ11_18790 [Streptomyces cinnamoneus]
MSGQDELDASSEALGQITKGIDDAIGELKELGMGMTGAANTGRGFDDLALSGLETGHDGLTSAFKTFCERWEWGVRSLVHDGNEFARRVGLSAGMYHEQDKYVKGTFKVVVAGFGADPTLADKDVQEMSVDEIADHGNFAHADYSGKSFEDAFHHVVETDKATAKDAVESGKVGPATLLADQAERARRAGGAR